MTAPPLDRGTLNRTPAPDRDTNPMRDLHPDVIAYCEAHGITRERGVRYVQRQYDAGLMARERREEATPTLVRTLDRRGSVPVDGPVGERVASRRRW